MPLFLLFDCTFLGMTNRPDLIDEALLRPGRLEVKMEIGENKPSWLISLGHISTRCSSTSQHLISFQVIMCEFLFSSRPAWWDGPTSNSQHPHREDETVQHACQRRRRQRASRRDQELQRSWAGRSGSGCPVDCYEPPHQGLGSKNLEPFFASFHDVLKLNLFRALLGTQLSCQSYKISFNSIDIRLQQYMRAEVFMCICDSICAWL